MKQMTFLRPYQQVSKANRYLLRRAMMFSMCVVLSRCGGLGGSAEGSVSSPFTPPQR